MLSARMLMAAANQPVVLAFTAKDKDSVDRTTYTFSGLAIGAAATNRKIVVGAFTGGSNRTIVSVKVAGASASAVVTVDTSSDIQALYQIDVPTGTTADIEIVFSAIASRCGVGVWALYNAKAAANDTDTGTGTSSVAGTISVPAGGVAIGYIGCVGDPNAVISGDGLTKDFDQAIEATGQVTHGGGSGAYAVANASLTINGTTTGASRATGVYASWAHR